MYTYYGENMRKTYIEFMRIIVCLFVIMIHMNTYQQHYPIKAFITAGVPIFSLITGYFLFDGKFKYKDLLIKTFIKTILPTLILITFSVLFKEWIIGKSSFFESLKYFKFHDLLNCYKYVFTLKFYFGDINFLFEHLWYLQYYCILIILYPLLKSVCTNNKKCNTIRHLIIIIFIIKIILSDLYNMGFLNSFYDLFKNNILLFFILGYELKIQEDKLINKKSKNIILGISLIIIGILYRIYLSKNANLYDMFYYTKKQNLATIFCSVGFFISFSNILLNFNNKIINYIGDKTLGIYLIHYIIIIKLKTISGLFISIEKMNSLSWYNQIIFEILYILLVFIISFIIVTILKESYKFIKNLILKKKKSELLKQ